MVIIILQSKYDTVVLYCTVQISITVLFQFALLRIKGQITNNQILSTVTSPGHQEEKNVNVVD